ncbi:MAG: twin-arginine translocation signal domain-containing protein [Thermodesulfobacteriota bacterium]
MSDESRRNFLKKCGLAVLATASYTAISVLGRPSTAEAQSCTSSGCTDFCVSSCTGCTTAPCFTVPEPSEPEPVE